MTEAETAFELIGEPPVLPDGRSVPLSPAVKVGEQLHLSGVLAFRPDGSFPEGIESQTQQCLENIRAALNLAGSGLGDVFKVTVWLVDRKDFAGFNKVYGEFFAQRPPARSAVCSELMIPGALVEIEVIAACLESEPGL